MRVRLPPHVVFRELPFCGVLLDSRRSQVFRLSQRGAAALRQALHGPDATSPYESLINVAAPDPAMTRTLVDRLLAAGLVCSDEAADDHG